MPTAVSTALLFWGLSQLPAHAPEVPRARWVPGQGVGFSARGHAPTTTAGFGDAHIERSGERVRGSETEARPRGPGVELAWRFAGPPAGSGPLEVALQPRALVWAGESGSGLHFLDPASGLRVRVSNGVWVESTGRRTVLPARFASGHVTWQVDAATLAATAWPAVLDPLITPEIGFDQPVAVPAADEQVDPSAATDGAGRWLVVWNDLRSAQGSYDIWFSLVDSTGAVLTPDGVALATFLEDDFDPTVAFGAGRFLVVWQQSGSALYGALIDTSGTLLSPGIFPIALSGTNERPRVAFDGTNFQLVWVLDSGNHSNTLAQISPAGVVTPFGGARFTPTLSNQQSARIACTGGPDCLVVWSDNRLNALGDIYASRVTSGANLDPNGLVVDGTPDAGKLSPIAAWNGAHWLVSWTQNQVSAGPGDIYAARIDAQGTRADPVSIPITVAAGNQTAPRVVRDGAGFLVVYNNANLTRLEAMRIDADGGRIDAAPVRVCPACSPWSTESGNLAPPAVAGGLPLLTWADFRRGERDIFGARLGAVPQTVEDGGFPLVLSVNAQNHPALAHDGQRYLAVWNDARQGTRGAIVGALVDEFGKALAPDGGVLVFSDPNDLAQSPGLDPRVAYGGGKFFVVWSGGQGNQTTIFGRTFAVDSGFLETRPFHLADAGSPNEFTPRIAASSTQFLVAYDLNGGISARRFPFSGAPLDPNGVVVSVPGLDNDDTENVASLNDDFVVAFTRNNTTAATHYVRLGRVTSAGASPDGPNGILASAAFEADSETPSISCQPQGCLVVWEENAEIVARVFDAALQNPTPIRFFVSRAGNQQIEPVAAWQGGRWRVVWNDARSELKTELWSTEVLADGQVVTPAGELLVTGPSHLREPALASMGPGRSLLAYTAFDPAGGQRAFRVKARALLELPLGSACGAAAQCQSGFCVDGVCCDTACGNGASDCQACSASGVCTVAGSSQTCRPAVSVCDVVESCDGTSAVCPADAFQPDDAVCNIDGSCTQGVCVGGTPPVPGFTSTPTVYLTCSQPLRYGTSGGPVVSGPGPVVYALAPLPGDTIPDGLTVDAATGELSWEPTPDQAGEHRAVLIARGAGWAASQTLVLEVECRKRAATIGCGCANAGGWWGALPLILGLWRRQRRPRT